MNEEERIASQRAAFRLGYSEGHSAGARAQRATDGLVRADPLDLVAYADEIFDALLERRAKPA